MKVFAGLCVLGGLTMMIYGAFSWDPSAGYILCGVITIFSGISISKTAEAKDKEQELSELNDTLQKLKDMMN